MYYRIYKALNILLWMIPCRKKKVLKRWWSTQLLFKFTSSPACLYCCRTLINIHYSLYNYKCINECFYLGYKYYNK